MAKSKLISAVQAIIKPAKIGDTARYIEDGGGVAHPVEDQEAREMLDKKVDKEEGKGLSTNDFTDQFKTKLDDMPSIWHIEYQGPLSVNFNTELNLSIGDFKKSIGDCIIVTFGNSVTNTCAQNDPLWLHINNEGYEVYGMDQNNVYLRYIKEQTTMAFVYTGSGYIQLLNIIQVDNALSNTSENPVQNKVVAAEFDKKLDISGGTMTGPLKNDVSIDTQELSINGDWVLNSGGWSDDTYLLATEAKPGLMSPGDKKNIDDMAETIDSKLDKSGGTVTGNLAINGWANLKGGISVAGTDFIDSNGETNPDWDATHDKSGFMSGEDKKKLDGIVTDMDEGFKTIYVMPSNASEISSPLVKKILDRVKSTNEVIYNSLPDALLKCENGTKILLLPGRHYVGDKLDLKGYNALHIKGINVYGSLAYIQKDDSDGFATIDVSGCNLCKIENVSIYGSITSAKENIWGLELINSDITSDSTNILLNTEDIGTIYKSYCQQLVIMDCRFHKKSNFDTVISFCCGNIYSGASTYYKLVNNVVYDNTNPTNNDILSKFVYNVRKKDIDADYAAIVYGNVNAVEDTE